MKSIIILVPPFSLSYFNFLCLSLDCRQAFNHAQLRWNFIDLTCILFLQMFTNFVVETDQKDNGRKSPNGNGGFSFDPLPPVITLRFAVFTFGWGFTVNCAGCSWFYDRFGCWLCLWSGDYRVCVRDLWRFLGYLLCLFFYRFHHFILVYRNWIPSSLCVGVSHFQMGVSFWRWILASC